MTFFERGPQAHTANKNSFAEDPKLSAPIPALLTPQVKRTGPRQTGADTVCLNSLSSASREGPTLGSGYDATVYVETRNESQEDHVLSSEPAGVDINNSTAVKGDRMVDAPMIQRRRRIWRFGFQQVRPIIHSVALRR